MPQPKKKNWFDYADIDSLIPDLGIEKSAPIPSVLDTYRQFQSQIPKVGIPKPPVTPELPGIPTPESILGMVMKPYTEQAMTPLRSSIMKPFVTSALKGTPWEDKQNDIMEYAEASGYDPYTLATSLAKQSRTKSRGLFEVAMGQRPATTNDIIYASQGLPTNEESIRKVLNQLNLTTYLDQAPQIVAGASASKRSLGEYIAGHIAAQKQLERSQELQAERDAQIQSGVKEATSTDFWRWGVGMEPTSGSVASILRKANLPQFVDQAGLIAGSLPPDHNVGESVYNWVQQQESTAHRDIMLGTGEAEYSKADYRRIFKKVESGKISISDALRQVGSPYADDPDFAFGVVSSWKPGGYGTKSVGDMGDIAYDLQKYWQSMSPESMAAAQNQLQFLSPESTKAYQQLQGLAPTTVDLSGGKTSYIGQEGAILSRIGQIAKSVGLDDAGAMAAMAVAATEGGLTGALGDNDTSAGPFQFHEGGQLNNYAKFLGVGIPEAKEYARTHIEEAAKWALQNYLGDAIKAGQAKGLTGPELSTYAQQYGQVSVSPERAGQNWTHMFGTIGDVAGQATELAGQGLNWLGEQGTNVVSGLKELGKLAPDIMSIAAHPPGHPSPPPIYGPQELSPEVQRLVQAAGIVANPIEALPAWLRPSGDISTTLALMGGLGGAPEVVRGGPGPVRPTIKPSTSTTEVAVEAAGKKAPAEFLGMQEVPDHAPIELYNLTEDIPNHPAGSTVTRKTLEDAGFAVSEPTASILDSTTMSTKTYASVPVMITKDMESHLIDRGFTQEQINKMTPQEAWEVLNAIPSQVEPYTAAQFRSDLVTELKATDEQADAVVILANAWARSNKEDLDTYVGRKIYGLKGIKEEVPTTQRGITEFLDDGKAIIRSFSKGDFSTIVHELIHVFSGDLNPDEIQIVKAVFGTTKSKKAATLSVQELEGLATWGEKYIITGQAPTRDLIPVFEKMKTWMTDIYQGMRDMLEGKINPEVEKIFNARLRGEQYRISPIEDFVAPKTAFSPTAVESDPWRAVVENKLKVGMPVSPETLADYPDLAAKYGIDIVLESLFPSAPETPIIDRLVPAKTTLKYDAIQQQIDETSDRLMERGMSWKDAENSPEVQALYEKRFEVERAEMQRLNDNVNRRIDELNLQMDESTRRYLLEQIYSILPAERQAATYMGNTYTLSAIKEDQATKAKVAKSFLEDWARRNNYDIETIFSPISGLSKTQQQTVLQKIANDAEEFHNAVVRGLSESEPEREILFQGPISSPEDSQLHRILEQNDRPPTLRAALQETARPTVEQRIAKLGGDKSIKNATYVPAPYEQADVYYNQFLKDHPDLGQRLQDWAQGKPIIRQAGMLLEPASASVARAGEGNPIRLLMGKYRLYLDSQQSAMWATWRKIGNDASKILGLDQSTGKVSKVATRPTSAARSRLGYLDDIFDNPNSYNPTPEQTSVIKSIRSTLDALGISEFKAGQNYEPADRYFPRVVKKTPTGEKLEVTPKGYQKVRTFKTSQAAVDAGYTLANPYEALGARLENGVRTIANANLRAKVAELGQLPSERVRADTGTLATEFVNAKKDYSVARAKLIKAQKAGDKSTIEDAQGQLGMAQENLNRTNTALRYAKAKARQPHAGEAVRLGRIYSEQDIVAELDKFISPSGMATMKGEGLPEMVLQFIRGVQTSFDTGHIFIQGAPLFYSRPDAFMRMTAEAIGSFARQPDAYISNNFSHIIDGINNFAIVRPTELIINEKKGISGAILHIPGVSQNQRAFENLIMVGQTELWKAFKGMEKAGLDKTETAALIRKTLGVTLSPGLTSTERFQRTVALFAPRLAAAVTSLATDTLRGGLRGQVARQTMGRVIGGSVALTMGWNYLLNGDTGNWTDVNKGSWASIRVGGRYVNIMGPIFPYLRATVRSAAGVAAGKPKVVAEQAAILAQGKLSSLLGPFATFLSGTDWKGNPVERGLMGLAQSYMGSLRPIGTGDVAERIVTALEGGTPFEATDILPALGVRVNPLTSSARMQELAAQKGITPPEGQTRLTRAQQWQLEISPEGRAIRHQGPQDKAQERRATELRYYDAQVARDQLFTSGQMSAADWINAYRNDQAQQAGELKQFQGSYTGKTDTPEEKTINDYYQLQQSFSDPKTNTFDSSGWSEAKQKFLNKLPSDLRHFVTDYTTAHDTPTLKEFKQAESLLARYWQVPELVQGKAPAMKTMQEQIDKLKITDPVRAKALESTEMWKKYQALVSQVRKQIRASSPEIDAALKKWYGY